MSQIRHGRRAWLWTEMIVFEVHKSVNCRAGRLLAVPTACAPDMGVN